LAARRKKLLIYDFLIAGFSNVSQPRFNQQSSIDNQQLAV